MSGRDPFEDELPDAPRATGRRGAAASDVTDERFLAWGHGDDLHAALWSSLDGVRWRQIDLGSDMTRGDGVTAAAAQGNALVVWAYAGEQGSFWVGMETDYRSASSWMVLRGRCRGLLGADQID